MTLLAGGGFSDYLIIMGQEVWFGPNQLDCSFGAAVDPPNAGTQKEPKSVSLSYRGSGYLLNLYEF